MQGATIRNDSQNVPIRRKHGRSNRTLKRKTPELPPGIIVPELYRAILTSAGQGPSIWVDRQRPNRRPMPAYRVDRFSEVTHVPEFYRVGAAAGGHPFAIWRNGQAGYGSLVLHATVCVLFRNEVPNSKRFIAAAAG